MLEIEKIPAKPKEEKVIRVAAYARVSSDKDSAFHSLEAQREYYNEYVKRHPNWVLAGIYSDNAISGTLINRPEFQRMLQDCRDGKIDLVITKSITRFARNTINLLETIRELKSLGIDCYFEKENMHSISPDGELLITLLAMYAEEEARSASENQKWRIQKLFDEGKVPGGTLFGYQLANGKYEIVPEEAEIVRRIYDLYLSGMGYYRIAETLTSSGVVTRRGGMWAETQIRKVLVNEKYIGDLCLQKTFIEDFRTKKKRKNNGERRKVYVKNSHDAIIDRATYEEVQREMERRRSKHYIEKKPHIGSDDDRHLFTGLIICGDCGCTYRHKKTKTSNGYIVSWRCRKYQKFGLKSCHSKEVPEYILIEKTQELLETDKLSGDLIRQKISHIRIHNGNLLVYELRDGTFVELHWQRKPRKCQTDSHPKHVNEENIEASKDDKEDV